MLFVLVSAVSDGTMDSGMYILQSQGGLWLSTERKILCCAILESIARVHKVRMTSIEFCMSYNGWLLCEHDVIILARS